MEDPESDGMEIENESQVYMACILHGHRIGIAYYDCFDQKLSVIEAWGEGDEDFPLIQILKCQVLPAVIYTSTKMDEMFLLALKKKPICTTRELSVKTLRSSVFSYEQAWHRLAFVQVHGMKEDLNVKERTYLLRSMMNLDSEMQVRAAGGLLQILQDEMIIDPVNNNEYDTNILQIRSISEIAMDNFLTLDLQTYDALQIFKNDIHPSCMGIGKPKEGFSLFGIFADKCFTIMGRRLLRNWFLRPILDLNVLNDRLDFVSAFLELDELVGGFHQSLRHVKDIPKLLKRFSRASSLSTCSDWQQLSKFVSASLHIREIMEVGVSQKQDKYSIQNLHLVKKVLSIRVEELISINELIIRVIEIGQICGESSDTMIAKGICEELDDLKHIYEGLTDFLDQVAALELKRLTTQHGDIYPGSIIYLPQIGYLLRLSGRKLEPEILQELPDFEFVFASGDNDHEYFYRTSKTKELDVMLGDILHKILDMERAILRDLELRIVTSSDLLVAVANITAELDCLLAFASIAREGKYVQPNVTEKNVLYIEKGRHPLQEIIMDTFVPNSTESFLKGHVNIITGPNYSGKSVYVKQVALIVFLSHIGSFVPAERATIGLVDRIFCAVACKHTVILQESTFMMDLHRVAIMLRNSTERSLCILDEFGKGTLASANILHGYHNVTSNVTSMYLLAHISLRCLIQVFCQSVLENCKANGESDQDIIFLYRLISGHTLPSYGLYCAKLSGVLDLVLHRASTIVGLIQDGKPIDRINSDKMTSKDKNYKVLVETLLAFDCNNGNLHKFLQDIISLHDTNDMNDQIG